MLSLTDATSLINSIGDFETVVKLLSTLGFPDAPLPLDSPSVTKLGIDTVVARANIAAGEGSLRALVVEPSQSLSIRDTLDFIARKISHRVPHLTWLVVATSPHTSTVAIATWRNDRSTPALFALVTERFRVTDSDAETLCALAACSPCTPDTMRHLRWCEVLGRDGITRRFFRALERAVHGLAHSLPASIEADDRRQLALTLSSRMLFLSFLETKGWLNRDFGFLSNGFAECMAHGGAYHARVLDALFFGTLNTRVRSRAQRSLAFGSVPFLNGGLFSRTHLERAHRGTRFSDDAIGDLFGNVLVRYRFTAREDARTWSQAAVNPEMLGKAFESLMTRDERKRSGVFYTPQHLVQRIVRTTFEQSLSAKIGDCDLEALLTDGSLSQTMRAALLEATASIRILDPACGSGAFLVNALELMTALRLAGGDKRSIAVIRREIVTRSIFGVDINPTAVWLCQLRLWLSVVIDSDERDPSRVLPLPNLDRQIRAGDSLAGDAFDGARAAAAGRAMQRVRRRYAATSGARKATLARDLDRRERKCALAVTDHAIKMIVAERKEIVIAARSPDLFRATVGPAPATRRRLQELRTRIRSLRRRHHALESGAALPFSYAAHFADVAAAAGFDVIIGNPPWVRPHNVSADARQEYGESFETYRNAPWKDGAEASHAGNGFAAQVDLAALFVERSIDLAAPGGAIGLLLPSKLFRSLAGGGMRKLLLERTHVSLVHDAEEPTAFNAATYPAIIVARQTSAKPDASTRHGYNQTIVAVTRKGSTSEWSTCPKTLALDSSLGSPWLLLPPGVRRAFDSVIAHGTPLSRSPFGRPWLGVKTGCNDAFIIDHIENTGETSNAHHGDRHGFIETPMLRPLVRGETLTRWTIERPSEHILWTDDNGTPMKQLPPLARAWLERWRPTLERRSDARSTQRWWSLFRTEIASSHLSRVVWCDFGRVPRAAFVPRDDPVVPLNTCYAVACPTTADALALTTLINSPVAAAWLAAIAEPARGNYHRYLGWTMALFPIPTDWPAARDVLAPVASRAINGDVPGEDELITLACAAYAIDRGKIQPLLDWFA